MPPPSSPQIGTIDAERIAALEARLARLEAHLGLAAEAVTANEAEAAPSATANEPIPASPTVPTEGHDDFEDEVGQNWFAVAGIVALTAGAGYMLSLPHAGWPKPVPSLAGYAVVALLFALARAWRTSFETVASYLRAVAMVLACFATLRLVHPLPRAALGHDSPAGIAVLVLLALANLALAWRRQSPWLFGIAVGTALLAALASGSAVLFLAALPLLAWLIVTQSLRANWVVFPIGTIPLVAAAYIVWSLGNPFFAAWGFVPGARFAPLALLVASVVFAQALWRRPREEEEPTAMKVGALVNCAFGFGAFALHGVGAHSRDFPVLHAIAAITYLTLAIAFWRRHGSRVATFFYAMTGYAALSLAIIAASSMPSVFVWLSMQSLVVVTTAIWFRSRLIVVANFGIYVFIVLAYIVLAERETGISIGFGLVALLSARILNWQRDRLTLKTELMRNAYLVAAFLVFPYALAHLVPSHFVAVAWIVLAGAYYGMNLVVQNRKYRWLGHGTLVLTSIYVVVVGTRQLDPVYRTLSFLLLGVVLLGVSLAFTRGRKKARIQTPAAP